MAAISASSSICRGRTGRLVLPMAGGVGTQYTPTAGWARAIVYYRDTLGDASYRNSIAVAFGGDGSVATNGFWSALNTATTLRLPMLFYIEDNGFGISVPSTQQTPGGNIAANLASFRNLRITSADGCNPADTARCVSEAVSAVRGGEGPALVRLTMPRLSGHSGQDSQAYKSRELVALERAKDPLTALRRYLIPAVFSEDEWTRLQAEAEARGTCCIPGGARTAGTGCLACHWLRFRGASRERCTPARTGTGANTDQHAGRDPAHHGTRVKNQFQSSGLR